MLCHFLIGIPGTGKSTFAQLLNQIQYHKIISTDSIRNQLYGNETIQGNWAEIEGEVIKQIKTAFDSNTPVIYDATNAQRAWRIDLLTKIESRVKGIDWLAWYLNLGIKTAKKWNEQRDRTVPDHIIERMSEFLKRFPPHVAEGFVHLYEIKKSQNCTSDFVREKFESLKNSIKNRKNGTNTKNINFHAYSKLVDFDRLMHLISLLVAYPELGNLQYAYPDILEKIFGHPAVNFDDSLSEITGIMAKLKGNIYAQSSSIEQDLIFLENIGLIHSSRPASDTININNIPTIESSDIITHYGSTKDVFERLLRTTKVIIDNPLYPKLNSQQFSQIPYNDKIDNGYLTSLTDQLIRYENLADYEFKNRQEIFRKDLQYIFKPYQILPETMRNGYFFGTGILSQEELIDIFRLVQSQAQNIDDPLALDLYDKFKRKMKLAHFDDNNIYPVRAIANRSIVDTDSLNSQTLSKQTDRVQKIIKEGKLVKLNKFANSGNYEKEQKGAFDAWLLQIVFYNFAWYIGLQQEGGEKNKLFRFERLDRLYIENEMNTNRSIVEQKKALNKLTKLQSSSFGIHLGNDAKQQHLFLSNKKEDKKQVEVKVELWFSETIFTFIAEGTKRFSPQQMKMTKPPHRSFNGDKNIFTLKKTTDPQKPYRFQLFLPQWSLNDFDLIRWILGFGGEVKVHEPELLQEKIISLSKSTINVYDCNLDSI